MNKKIIILFLAMLLLTSVINIPAKILQNNKENTNILNLKPSLIDQCWIKVFGGKDNDDIGYSIIQVDDGYVIAGQHPSLKIWLFKLDSNGEKIWAKDFGKGRAYDLKQTTDGGFIIAGSYTFRTSCSLSTYPSSIKLIKTDNMGQKEWVKVFDSNEEHGFSVSQTRDGGFILSGDNATGKDYNHHRPVLIKTNSNGDLEWKKVLDLQRNLKKYINKVEETKDGYILIGDSVIKTNREGDYISHFQTDGYQGQQTNDGGVVVVGKIDQSFYDSDLLLQKYKINGELEWEKVYGGKNNDYGNSVKQTSDGGYIITGQKESETEENLFGYYSYVWIIKTDRNGEIEWQRFYSVGKDKDDSGSYITQTSDNGYVLIGKCGCRDYFVFPIHSVSYNLIVIKTNEEGKVKLNNNIIKGYFKTNLLNFLNTKTLIKNIINL